MSAILTGPGLVVGGGGGGGAITAADIVAALASAADAEAVRVALNPQTTYDGSSSTGWTASNGGTGRSASIATNRFNVSIAAAQGGAEGWTPDADHPRIYRDLSAALANASEDWSVVARLAVHSLGGRAALAVGDTSDAAGAFVSVAADGTVSYTGSWGSGADVSTGAGALPVDGTGWLVLWSRGGELSGGYGTGTSSTPPSRWKTFADGGNRTRPVVSRVTLYAFDASGVGATVAFDDVRIIDGR